MNNRFQEILNLAQTGHAKDALVKCERAIKKKPKDVDYLLLAASLYAQNHEYEKVKEYCVRAQRIEPRNEQILYNLVIACLFLEDYDCAIKYSLLHIKFNKKQAGAHANIALAYWHSGELEKAKESALKANSLDPRIATNHNNLGLIYKSLEEVDKALPHFQQSFKIDPQLAEAYYNYGITLVDKGDEQGNSYIDKALQIKPDYAEAYNYKGLKLLEQDELEQAIDNFKKAVLFKADYVEAYCNLGNAFMMQQEFKLAETMYRKAIEHNPEYANAYNNLGNALLDQEDYRHYFSEAEECYLRAIKLAPELNDTYKNLAVCYLSEGMHDKALHYFTIYNDKVPDDEVVIAGMATVCERSGKFDEGFKLVQPLIHREGIGAEIILANAALARHFKQEDEAIGSLLTITDSEIPVRLQIEKYYSLGKLSEAKGDIDTTFSYYRKANDLDEFEFDIALEKSKFEIIRSFYSRKKLHDLPHSENTSRLPIFIVGMPRSGTSLAEQILASHPEVYGAGELENIHLLTQRIGRELKPENNYPYCLDSMNGEYATQIATEHVNTLQKMAPEATYIVDKMPHNFMGLGLISLLFPGATIIHCKRSSVDTCLSIYFQHFNKHHAYSNNLKMLGQYYNLYSDLMDHWKQSLDMDIIELEYEKVIAAPEEEMRHLLECCGISWDPACLKFHENKRTVKTPSYDQVRRPIYTSSVAKWKKYEHQLEDLIGALGARAY